MDKKIVHYINYASFIGNLTIISDGDNLLGLFIEGQKNFVIKEDMVLQNDMVLEKTKDWLNKYFAGQRPNPKDLPLKPSGSFFQQLVWNLLLEIPYGEVTSYGEITKRVEHILGKRMSCQAVGGAIGHNPISIIIPCHRVIGKNGNLTGYAGGMKNKQILLNFERG